MAGAGSSQRRKVVLVVEDEPAVREALGLILDEIYEVWFADDGRVALDLVRSRSPDLVLLDLGLPIMGGLEVLAETRAIAPQLPVVILTITATAESAVRAMKLGALDYLIKPFRDEVVLDVVRETLAASRRHGDRWNEHGDGASGWDAEPRRASGRLGTRRRCLVLASHVGTAGTLKLVLERDVTTDVAMDTMSAIHSLEGTAPDCLVCDEQGWATGGAALARMVRAAHPRCRIALVARGEAVDGYRWAGEFVDAVISERMGLGELLRRTLSLCALEGGGSPRLRLHERVIAAIDYLRLRYAEAVSAEAIAGAVRMSRSGLAGLFRAELGMSLTEYVSALRVEIAKLLLGRHGVKLEEVARQLGFFDASHFSRAFQRQTGHRPGAYRDEFLGQWCHQRRAQ